MLLLFIKFHVSIKIFVMNKLRTKISQFHLLYFLYNNTFLMYSSTATWLISVHSLTKLAENVQSPQHRNINFIANTFNTLRPASNIHCSRKN